VDPHTPPLDWHDSLWRKSPEHQSNPTLAVDMSTDVVVIGAGFTGLRAARILAEHGKSVVVLEAQDVGWGASGRSGGQVNPMLPFNSPERIQSLIGPKAFKRLAHASLNSANELFRVVERDQIRCDARQHGWLRVLHSAAALRDARRRPEFWLLFVAFPLVGLTEGLVLTHIIPILVSSGLSPASAVAVSALFGPMQVVGRLAMLGLAGRVRALVMALLSFGGILGAVLLLMLVEDLPAGAYGFAMLFGASYGLISILKPVVNAEVLGRTGFGAIAGSLAVPFLVAMAISPLIGSLLERAGGYGLALMVSAATATVAIGLMLGLSVLVRRRAAHGGFTPD